MNKDAPIIDNKAPRLRLSDHVDLGKANRACDRCNGGGIVRFEEIDDKNKKLNVPVICRCVSRNGGIKPDMFDKMISEMHEQVVNGTFAENLSGDIMRLPNEQRDNAVRQIRNQILKAHNSGNLVVEKQLKSAVARINLLRAEEK